MGEWIWRRNSRPVILNLIGSYINVSLAPSTSCLVHSSCQCESRAMHSTDLCGVRLTTYKTRLTETEQWSCYEISVFRRDEVVSENRPQYTSLFKRMSGSSDSVDWCDWPRRMPSAIVSPSHVYLIIYIYMHFCEHGKYAWMCCISV